MRFTTCRLFTWCHLQMEDAHVQEIKNMSINVDTWWENILEEQENKQMTGFIICSDDKHYLRPWYKHAHEDEPSVNAWRGWVCAQESRDRKNSSELKRQRCLKWETRAIGRGGVERRERNTVKLHSSHVGISVGKTWLLKTTTTQECLSGFVMLYSVFSTFTFNELLKCEYRFRF